MTAVVCPHCNVPLPFAPTTAVRCEACRLLVAAGRAIPVGSRPRTAGTIGGASGRLRNEAAREDAQPIDEARVLASLNAVAASLDVDVSRLRLFDYERAQRVDPSLVRISSVLATFGTWKHARAQARVAQSPQQPTSG